MVAHPDDMEYGAAAAVARWTAQGKTVVYAMVTSGEAGIDSIDPAECGPLREAEQIASAALVGVDTVEFLRHPDGTVEYGLPLRRDLARLVRRHRPEIVITTNFRETYGGVFPNQADHIAAGRATLDAVRDAGNRWVFRELTAEGHEPWNGVRQVWAAAPRSPGTAWTPPTPSRPGWPRWRPTRPTWPASADRWRTPAASWSRWAGAPDHDSGAGSPPPSK